MIRQMPKAPQKQQAEFFSFLRKAFQQSEGVPEAHAGILLHCTINAVLKLYNLKGVFYVHKSVDFKVYYIIIFPKER